MQTVDYRPEVKYRLIGKNTDCRPEVKTDWSGKKEDCKPKVKYRLVGEKCRLQTRGKLQTRRGKYADCKGNVNIVSNKQSHVKLNWFLVISKFIP